MEPINSPQYWKKRVSEFSQRKGMSKRARTSFYLEFFISAYLDNKSKIARKLGVPFSEVIFDNPNAPIIGKIVQKYGFYDEIELKRVSEGFYHFYRISQFWNEYWATNYTTLRKDIDKRFLTRCAFSFLTLSYPATYTSYLNKNSRSLFSLFDDRVKEFGFSSIAKLMECSLVFCQPGFKLTFPWDPRNPDNPNLIWNHYDMKESFEDFKEVLGNFLHSGYSMRHEDYSLLEKIRSGVLPLQYSWLRNSTNETIQDKQSINLLIQKYSKTPIPSTIPVEDGFEQLSTTEKGQLSNTEESLTSLACLEVDENDSYAHQVVTLLETVFIIEDLLLSKVLTVEEGEGNEKQLVTELKNILTTVTSLDSNVPYETLKLASDHLERFYVYLQELVANREKFKTIKPTLTDVLTDSRVLTAYQEERRTQAHIVQIQQAQLSEPNESQDSKYSLLKDIYLKQSKLLSNAMEQNRELKDQLQGSVPINSTKKVLSKYFSGDSLDRLIEYLKKNA